MLSSLEQMAKRDSDGLFGVRNSLVSSNLKQKMNECKPESEMTTPSNGDSNLFTSINDENSFISSYLNQDMNKCKQELILKNDSNKKQKRSAFRAWEKKLIGEGFDFLAEEEKHMGWSTAVLYLRQYFAEENAMHLNTDRMFRSLLMKYSDDTNRDCEKRKAVRRLFKPLLFHKDMRDFTLAKFQVTYLNSGRVKNANIVNPLTLSERKIRALDASLKNSGVTNPKLGKCHPCETCTTNNQRITELRKQVTSTERMYTVAAKRVIQLNLQLSLR